MNKLPAYGWTDHSEQVDVAALEARSWCMKTKMLWNGMVCTALLQAPDAETIRRLEAIEVVNKRRGVPGMISRFMDAAGKFDPAVQVFYTAAFDGHGGALKELMAMATTPEEAKKNHFGAVAMLAGALATWNTQSRQA